MLEGRHACVADLSGCLQLQCAALETVACIPGAKLTSLMAQGSLHPQLITFMRSPMRCAAPVVLTTPCIAKQHGHGLDVRYQSLPAACSRLCDAEHWSPEM